MRLFKLFLRNENLSIQKRSVFSLRNASEWYRNWFNAKNAPPYHHIVQIGDPVLRNKTEDIPQELIKSEPVQLLIKHLTTVLRKYKSVGISAPQIGIPWRVFIMELDERTYEKLSSDMKKNRQMVPVSRTVSTNGH